MKIYKLKTIYALLISFAFIFAACDESTTDPVVERPEPPTNMEATSLSDTEIGIKWDASTSESNAKFKGYVLTIAPGTFSPLSYNKGVTSATITGLTEGTVYTFTLKAEYTDGETSLTSASVQWSPATRFNNNGTGTEIKVYEYASSFGSGLDFYNGLNEAPETWTVSAGAKWNLALDTREGALIIGSPSLVTYNYTGTPPSVEFANTYVEAESLNEVYDSQALSALNYAERLIDLSTGYDKSIVIFARLKEGDAAEYTYVKLLLKYVGSSFLQGTAPNRYIQFFISYQKTPGVPYAV